MSYAPQCVQNLHVTFNARTTAIPAVGVEPTCAAATQAEARFPKSRRFMSDYDSALCEKLSRFGAFLVETLHTSIPIRHFQAGARSVEPLAALDAQHANSRAFFNLAALRLHLSLSCLLLAV